jgi:acyl carrier protein
MSSPEVPSPDRDAILSFLATLNHDPPSVDHLELDSVELLQFAIFLETRFHLHFEDYDLEPDDLRDLNKVLQLLQAHTTGHPGIAGAPPQDKA